MCRRAESLSELVLLVSVVTAALIGGQAYVRRGLQARYKNVVDTVGGSIEAATHLTAPTQYEPYYTSSDFTNKQTYRGIVSYAPGGRGKEGGHTESKREGSMTTDWNLNADDQWEK